MSETKAVALLSGGLDSTLAIRVIQEQGVRVVALNFVSPFCLCNRKGGCRHEARRAALELGIEIKTLNVAEEFLEVVRNPVHGYGKNLNPCIDCRILMYRKAKDWMQQIGASFLITGEVLGQRPMSQHRTALRIIERESELEGWVLRPLSAQRLPITIPEREGKIDHSRLLDLSGRSRRPQMALAQAYGINDYPCPAGGCLLTDPGFARRMKDLLRYAQPTLNDIELLKVGRHFRLSPTARIVLGRNQEENQRLLMLARTSDICLEPSEDRGPTGVGRGDFDQTLLWKASQIMARYCDSHANGEVKIMNRKLPQGATSSIIAKALNEIELQALRI